MNKRKTKLALFVLLCSLLVAGAVRAMVLPVLYISSWNVIGGGAGSTMSGGGYTLDSNLGQMAAGWSTDGHQLGSGFWYGVAVVETPTSTPVPTATPIPSITPTSTATPGSYLPVILKGYSN